jgi:hypothetical protein
VGEQGSSDFYESTVSFTKNAKEHEMYHLKDKYIYKVLRLKRCRPSFVSYGLFQQSFLRGAMSPLSEIGAKNVEIMHKGKSYQSRISGVFAGRDALRRIPESGK